MQRHEVQPDVYCRRLNLPAPMAVSARTGPLTNLWTAITRVALNPCVHALDEPISSPCFCSAFQLRLYRAWRIARDQADFQDDVDNTRAKVDTIARSAYTAHRGRHGRRDDAHGGRRRVDAVSGVHAERVLAVDRAGHRLVRCEGRIGRGVVSDHGERMPDQVTRRLSGRTVERTILAYTYIACVALCIITTCLCTAPAHSRTLALRLALDSSHPH